VPLAPHPNQSLQPNQITEMPQYLLDGRIDNVGRILNGLVDGLARTKAVGMEA